MLESGRSAWMRSTLALLICLAAQLNPQEAVATGSDISQPEFDSGDVTLLHQDLTVATVYLTDIVRLRNGAPLPEPAEVRLRCDGKDDFRLNLSKGAGSVFNGVGRSRTMFGRIQADENPGQVDVCGCAVRACYDSKEIQLTTRDALASPDVGVLVLTPINGGGGGTISVTSQLATKRARMLYVKA